MIQLISRVDIEQFFSNITVLHQFPFSSLLLLKVVENHCVAHNTIPLVYSRSSFLRLTHYLGKWLIDINYRDAHPWVNEIEFYMYSSEPTPEKELKLDYSESALIELQQAFDELIYD